MSRARANSLLKRGGGSMERVDSEALEGVVAPAPDDELLAVDEALDRLRRRIRQWGKSCACATSRA